MMNRSTQRVAALGAAILAATILAATILAAPVLAAQPHAERPLHRSFQAEPARAADEPDSDPRRARSVAADTRAPGASGPTGALRAANARRPGNDRKPERGSSPASALTRDGEVLMEVRFAPGKAAPTRNALRAAGLQVRNQVTPNVVEAWVDARRLDALSRRLPDAIIRPARLVRPQVDPQHAGSVNSEALERIATPVYHDLGGDGTGARIAVIDVGFAGWQGLQTTGDWPAGAQLERFQMDGNTALDCSQTTCAGFESDSHGASVVEIALDTAPDATFRVYRVQTVGEWYAAILHASDGATWADGTGADVISASLSAPLDGVGDGSACPPNWGDPCGTIAEAAEIAYKRGSAVVVPAGNNAPDHWGGEYAPLRINVRPWQDAHDFGGGNDLNVSPFCLPDGFPVRVEMFWADWTAVEHDYDAFLYRREADDINGWTLVARSIDFQTGAPASQNPQEFLTFNASGTSSGCDSGFSNYAIQIRRWNAPENRNIQLFTNIGLGVNVPERSLGFPADSPAVFAVGAVELDDTLASFSSRGPILAPGGDLPSDANPPLVDKPDGVSYSGVSTVTDGANGFAGTSAAVPHVAGIAAMKTELRDANPSPLDNNQAEALLVSMAWIALRNGNDLGDPGHDVEFGWGRVKLETCEQNLVTPADTWIKFSPACERLEDDALEAVFGSSTLGQYGIDWTVFEYSAIDRRYVLLSETDSMRPTIGHWIYSNADAQATFNGMLPDITKGLAFDGFGEPGPNNLGVANMLGNPRSVAFKWSEVQFFYNGGSNDLATAVADGVVRSMMWKWNPTTSAYEEFNGLIEEGTIEPGEAFFIRMLAPAQVVLPSPIELGSSASLGASRVMAPAASDAGFWQATVELSGENGASSVIIGQHPAAINGFGWYDAEKFAGPSASDVTLSIPSRHMRSLTMPLARDVRHPLPQAQWQIEIDVTRSGTYRLSWNVPQAVSERSTITLPRGRKIAADQYGQQVEVFLPAGTHRIGWQYKKNRTAQAAAR